MAILTERTCYRALGGHEFSDVAPRIHGLGDKLHRIGETLAPS